MDKQDLFEHSPAYYFENATKIQLKPGEMGLITAAKGLGKTSILVQFGIDTLLHDKTLAHVSFDQKSSNVISWYSSIINEITKKKNIDAAALCEEIMKNRTILNFNQETFTLPKVVNTLKALKDGGIPIETIVIDGLDLSKTSVPDLQCFSDFIKTEKITCWFSYTTQAATLKETLPEEKLNLFTAAAHLAVENKVLTLTPIKNGQGKVSLDTKTMLMCR